MTAEGPERDGFDLSELQTFVDDELKSEAARRAAFEARTIAIVTANLGSVTLFLAVRTQLDLQTALTKNPQHDRVVTALCFVAASLGFALLNALPMRNAAVSLHDLNVAYLAVKDGRAPFGLSAVVAVRLRQLRTMVRVNRVKAGLSTLAVLTYGIAVALLVWALGSASL